MTMDVLCSARESGITSCRSTTQLREEGFGSIGTHSTLLDMARLDLGLDLDGNSLVRQGRVHACIRWISPYSYYNWRRFRLWTDWLNPSQVFAMNGCLVSSTPVISYGLRLTLGDPASVFRLEFWLMKQIFNCFAHSLTHSLTRGQCGPVNLFLRRNSFAKVIFAAPSDSLCIASQDPFA